ncbi:MAG: hypothetical protein IKT27_06080 [Clostridia bacterium]|nr:hypothetical protein [Clostridia bacterium]
MNRVNISTHTRIAGRQVGIVHYAGGRFPEVIKDIELGNHSRSMRRQYAKSLLQDNEMGL